MDGLVLSQAMTPRIDTEKLVTVTEAAKILKVTRAAVYNAIYRGKLNTISIRGVVFIERSDLLKYKKSKSVGGRPKKKKP